MLRRHFVLRSAQAAAAFGILRSLGGCRPAAPAAGAGDAAFDAVRERYFLKFLELNPVTSTYLGGDGYHASLTGINRRLRDWSEAGLRAEREFYQGILTEVRAIAPADLSQGAAVDYRVLQSQVGFMLHEAERGYHHRAIDTYVAEAFRGVDWQIQQMAALDGGLLGTEEEWDQVVARVAAIPAFLDAARTNLAAGLAADHIPDRRMVAGDGIAGARANAEYFRTTLAATAKGYLGSRGFATSLLGRLGDGGRRAAEAWLGFADFLGSTYDPRDPADRYAAGEEEYTWRLRNCLQVTRGTAELFAYGAERVAFYEERMFEVASAVAGEAGLSLRFGTDGERRSSVRRVMEHLSKDSPRNDDELFRWYIEAGERAVAYGRAQAMFDIPADYRLDVVPTPPVLQSTIEAAYYPAPPFKQAGVGRFYLTPTGNDPGALRLNNRASVATTAVHEGFPGHDWHFKFMTRHKADISPIRWLTPGAVEDSSSMWEDSMATEGWGLYSEDLMAEPAEGRPHGFYTAAEHLYELQGQLLRAVRVRVDVGIHTERMTFDEAVDYFAEHAQFLPGACQREGRDADARAVCDASRRAMYRYSKWPTQAITYNLGMSEIVALREAVRQRQGAAFSAQAFHERLMQQGTIPAGFFRDSFVTGEK